MTQAHSVDPAKAPVRLSFKYYLWRQYLMDLVAPPLNPAPAALMAVFQYYPKPHQVVDRTKNGKLRCGFPRPW